jgi:Ca2+-binding RTX toxin-like protein
MLRGGEDDDILDGGADNDRVIGGSDDDEVMGGLGNDRLEGRTGDDNLDGDDGNDTVLGGDGDDIMTTGGGRDTVHIDPSNPNEGNDVVTDFRGPSGLDATSGDSINFALADVLAADPGLPAADGDAGTLSLADFDASANWTVDASEDGNLLLIHPNGSVELANVAFTGQTFTSLGSTITIDGAEFSEPIPVGDGTDDVAGDEDVAEEEVVMAQLAFPDPMQAAFA